MPKASQTTSSECARLSTTPRTRVFSLQFIGVALVLVVAAAIYMSRVPNEFSFDSEHKIQIQRIANELCAAASEKSCELTWAGKSKWFGTLEPSTGGTGKVGLEHIRKALPTPTWQESAESNGVVFKNENYEVFYSSSSGAVSITSAPQSERR
jgi:hypothetical protein